MSRLDEVKFDRGIALVHTDKRRDIYDPTKILDGLDSEVWHPHKILVVSEDGLELGNHYHEYNETFFVPTGKLECKLVDIDEPGNVKNVTLVKGSRLVIPGNVAHQVIGEKGSVIIGYGTAEFNVEGLISYKGNFN